MKFKLTKQIIEIDGKDFEVDAEVNLKEIIKEEKYNPFIEDD